MSQAIRPALPIYDEEHCTLFALGRNAMYAACQALGLRAGDEVLSPAFNCDGALQPFRVLGLPIRFVRSDPFTFAIELDDLRRRLSARTKLIHVINHFGMPQPWEALCALRRETGIPILEDNAYSLFSLQEPPLGTFGDLAIFSLRKNLPLLDGGLLRVNNPAYRVVPPEGSARGALPSHAEVIHLLKAGLGYSYAPEPLRRLLRRMRQTPVPPPPLYSDGNGGVPEWSARDVIGREFSENYLRPISGIARRQLNQLTPNDYVEIAQAKRRHYAWLSEQLRAVPGLQVLWPALPDGVVPSCISCLVATQRDRWLQVLQPQYEVMAWPTLSRLVLDQRRDFPELEILGRQLLQFNLLTERVRLPGYPQHLERFVRDLTALARERGGASTNGSR